MGFRRASLGGATSRSAGRYKVSLRGSSGRYSKLYGPTTYRNARHLSRDARAMGRRTKVERV